MLAYRVRSSQSYHYLCETERLLMEDIRNADTKPATRAQLARALDCIQERKRIARMKPAPKPVDVEHKRKRPPLASTTPIIYPDPTPSPPVMHDAGSSAPPDPAQ